MPALTAAVVAGLFPRPLQPSCRAIHPTKSSYREEEEDRGESSAGISGRPRAANSLAPRRRMLRQGKDEGESERVKKKRGYGKSEGGKETNGATTGANANV